MFLFVLLFIIVIAFIILSTVIRCKKSTQNNTSDEDDGIYAYAKFDPNSEDGMYMKEYDRLGYDKYCGVKIEKILTQDFPSHRFIKNCDSNNVLSIHDIKLTKYDFLIFNGETPVVAICILDHNDDTHNINKITKLLTKNEGIHYMAFYTQFENYTEYIKNRLDYFLS